MSGTKRCLDSSLSLRQIRLIHGRTSVTTSGDITGIHLCFIKRRIGNNDYMVLCKVSVTTVIVVIK